MRTFITSVASIIGYNLYPNWKVTFWTIPMLFAGMVFCIWQDILDIHNSYRESK